MRMPQVEGGREERGRKKNQDLTTVTAARSTASLFLSIDRTKDGMCKSPSVCCKMELAAVDLRERRCSCRIPDMRSGGSAPEEHPTPAAATGLLCPSPPSRGSRAGVSARPAATGLLFPSRPPGGAAPRRGERPARSYFRVERGMARDGGAAGMAASRELLAVGRRGGLEETLLINSKCSSKKATTLQTVKMPRSNVLDRVQSFLPQMAHANDELRRKMVTAPAHQFDIENVDSATEKVIEMNVAVVELNDSDIDEEILTSEDDSESEDDYITDEVTIDNIKFPKQKGEKGKIEILDSEAN
uniref:Uncharacterized protein n=1 Tax=Falco tinnunculus TaxID=100819 RepID=A0A8C4VDJ1_FALTI